MATSNPIYVGSFLILPRKENERKSRIQLPFGNILYYERENTILCYLKATFLED